MRGFALALALTTLTATGAAAQHTITASAVIVEPLEALRINVSMEAGALRVADMAPAALNTRVLRQTIVVRSSDPAGATSAAPTLIWTPAADGMRLERRPLTATMTPGIDANGLGSMPGGSRFLVTQVVAANS